MSVAEEMQTRCGTESIEVPRLLTLMAKADRYREMKRPIREVESVCEMDVDVTEEANDLKVIELLHNGNLLANLMLCASELVGERKG